MKTANVIITTSEFPSDGIKSWPQYVEYLLTKYNGNTIDYLLSAPSVEKLKSTTKHYTCNINTNRLLIKLKKDYKFKDYLNALKEIAIKYDKVYACIVDSTKLKFVLTDFIEREQLTDKVKIMYYQHGFSYYFTNAEMYYFTKHLSHLILLSKQSYQYELRHNLETPYSVSVLHNPINRKVFYKLSGNDKAILRKELGFNEQLTHFIWTGQNMPKKGIDLILRAWKLFYTPNKKAILHIVGLSQTIEIAGVHFAGKIPNTQLAKYVQASDISIFSSLWQEGFGLSLAEPMSCGLLSITSFVGGIPDFFEPGKHGIAIENPNFINDWVVAFDKALIDLPNFDNSFANQAVFMNYDEWCSKFVAIFKMLKDSEVYCL